MARLTRKEKKAIQREELKVNAEAMKDLGLSIPRVASMVSHAFLGANGGFTEDAPLTSSIMGAVNGLVLESLANSPFGGGVPGGAALTAGYGLLAVGQVDNTSLIDWLKKRYELYQLKNRLENTDYGLTPPTPDDYRNVEERDRGSPNWAPKPPKPPLPQPTKDLERRSGREILVPTTPAPSYPFKDLVPKPRPVDERRTQPTKPRWR